MTIKKNEWLRLTPFEDENGKRAVDLRVWKKTPTGGVPTTTSIVIDQRMVIPLIFQLQKIHQSVSAYTATDAS